MRYQSLPRSTPVMLSGPRGRTRAVLSSISHGVAGLPATVPAPEKKSRPLRPAAPVIHYETPVANRMAG